MLEWMKKITLEQKEELQTFIKTSDRGSEIKRAQTILMLDEKNGFSLMIRMTGYKRTQAYDIKKRYLNHGIGVLKDKRKGKPKELLTKKQREEIVETVKTKKPQECGLIGEHWITGTLGKWIEKEFEVKYKSKTSLYLIFRKAKFTYHKPGRVYDKRDEKEIRKWRKETKPKIKKYWKEKETIILCEDEMILTTETTTQKIWLPEGEFPKIECKTGGRKRRSVYGFLNIKTGEEYTIKTEFQNMQVTAVLLKEIRKIFPTQKIVLMWDNAGWHKGSAVQQYLKEDKKMNVIHFPRYAPEENPQEHVWKNGRSQCTHNKFIEDIDMATDELVEYFNKTKFSYSLLGFSSGL